MVTTNIGFIIVLLFLLVCMLNYTNRLNLLATRTTGRMDRISERILTEVEDSITPFSLFLHRAYIESSSNHSKIRLLSINRCLDPDAFIDGFVDGQQIALRAEPIEGTCPWIWAPGCLYNSYVFDGTLEGEVKNNYITFSRARKKVALPLERVPQRTKGTLTFCVPPVYWFTNWTKMIFALEMWKAQGVNHVIVYYHSSNEHVYDVLRHYEKEGFVTIVRWPSLPRDAFSDPNLSLYRLAHSLAQNDCVLRIDTEFGAVIDIDEVIFPRSGSLLTLVRNLFLDHPSAGALSFSHRSLIFEPPMAGQNFTFEKLDFSGIRNATEFKLQGPPKVIFRTETVDLLSTHDVRIYKSHVTTFKVPVEDAVLLHHRYNHVGGENPQRVDLLSSKADLDTFQEFLSYKACTVFPNGADFHFETQRALGMCLKSWRKDQHQCKTPLPSYFIGKTTSEDYRYLQLVDEFLSTFRLYGSSFFSMI
ncbi:unnamed protein product [Cylicocyclus nassatus]|uniref:Glycosyltransferase family 92 protein n=1 Tax=Cylicocyclus nassatus TaxID=53992 RepID=A0AA36DND2_CYLNA|nr:unnamed protein product [Cylicocyclus nassatus]